jgi:hypothetical protein
MTTALVSGSWEQFAAIIKKAIAAGGPPEGMSIRNRMY